MKKFGKEKMMYKIMTPGPTQVAENVRMARAKECTNPDLDLEFYDFYKETCEMISRLLHTDNETLILGGEGILGLEAACASLTEPGDRVLVLDNGEFGKGFADFVKIYGGEPVLYTTDYKNEIDVKQLETYLEQDSDFKYATVVHCDTPSGMLNDISKICPLLKKYNIATVVDSVSAMFGEYVNVDEFEIDLLCGGSQKAVSAPAGLTFVTISDTAKDIIKNRKVPVASFYCNLGIFEGYYENKWFPYTMPISDIYGLRAAFDNISNDPDRINRHERLAKKVRNTLLEHGFELYGESGYSNTVTAFLVPEGLTDEYILREMKEKYNIMLAGSFGEFAGKVIRIGHMGENATEENVDQVLEGIIDICKK